MESNNYLNLRLEQFLDAITNKKNIYELKLDNGDIFQGILSDFEKWFSKADAETRKKLLPLLNNKKEYKVDFELSTIEIINYLEKVTSNFDPIKTRVVLTDIEAYYHMDFRERIEKQSFAEYHKNNWEIPIKKLNLPEFSEKANNMPDIDKMLKKTHMFSQISIIQTINLLREKLKENRVIETENLKETNKTNSGNSENDLSDIFAKGGYELFLYLNENYVRDNKFRTTKYSNIFRVIENRFIIGTHDQYKDFILEKYGVKLSKILNNEYKESYKFKTKIKPHLLKLMEIFENEN